MSQKTSVIKAALPYAEALFELSQAIQLVEETRKDLDLILKTIEQSGKLGSFLVNPLVPIETKKDVLNDLFVSQVNPHVLNFLSILIERRRISLFYSVRNYYLDLVYRLQLVTLATVYSTTPLTAIQKQTLKNKLQFMTGSQEIQLIEHINTELIGGLIVKVGSKIIDMSISGQLSQMASYLNGIRP